MLSISRSTRNWILALVLIPAAAYGVARLAIWWSVKDSLTSVQESIEPFATMEHSRILSPVFGAFGATGIRIKPRMFEDEITIGSALVHIDDPVEKYHFLDATMNDTIPTSFNFSLNGLRVPLSGDIAGWLNAGAATAGATVEPASACAAGTGFTLADVRRMGYEELVANVIADYAYDRRGNGLSTYLKLEVQEMFELTLEGRIPPSDVVFTVDRISGVPRLSDLTITLSDLSWSSRFNKYCAGLLGMSEAAYIDKRMKDTREVFLEAGFDPSDALMSGLERFARGAVSMTLSLNPHDPFAPAEVKLQQDPSYLIDKLGIEVMFDGTPVQNLGAAAVVVEEEGEAEAEPVDETFKPTPVEELPQFLKNSVKIFTTDGKVHEGYLDSVDASRIVLTRHLAGGSATFDVGREQVEKVLVLRP